MGQLRTKIAHLDFAKHRERIFLEKLGLINQTKKDDLTMLNKDNMQLSYEIDELMDRVRMKKLEKMKRQQMQSPDKKRLLNREEEEILGASLQKSNLSALKKRNFANISMGTNSVTTRLDEKLPLLDPVKFA